MEIAKTVNKKVPGHVLPVGKLEEEAKKFEREIRKKKTSELKELLNRQNTILQNLKLIDSLPDKGEKVRQKQQQLMVRSIDRFYSVK